MKNKLFWIIFILFISSFTAEAKFTSAQKLELKRKIQKTRLHLKEVVTNDLKLAAGVQEILVSLDIKVNRRSLYKEVALIDEKWKDIEKLQLPSLFLDVDQQSRLKEVKEITIEHILGHIYQIDLSISTPYDILDEQLLKEKVTSIIKANYNQAERIKINIEFNKIEPLLIDNRKTSLKEKKPFYAEYLKKIEKISPYLGGFFLLFVFLGLLFLWIFRSSMKQVSKSVGNIQIKSDLQVPPSFTRARPEEKGKKAIQASAPIAQQNSFQSYLNLVSQLRMTTKDNIDLVLEILDLQLSMHEYARAFVLLNLLPQSTRENVYTNIEPLQVLALKKFIIKDGEELYKDEQTLGQLTKEVYQLLSIAKTRPDSLSHLFLGKMIKKLNSVQVVNLLKICSKKEITYLIENMDGIDLAYVFETNDLSEVSFSFESVELETDEVKDFIVKISNEMSVKDEKMDMPGKEILPYLNDQLATQYVEQMKISTELTFRKLCQNYLDFVVNYVKELAFEDIRDILILFTPEEKEYITAQLPDIIRENLDNQELSLNRRTIELKVELYKKLRVHHSIEEFSDKDKQGAADVNGQDHVA